MKARTLAIAAAASLALSAAPALAQSAPQSAPAIKGQVQAPPPSITGTIATYLPVSLWTITGAVIGAVAWPGLAAGTLSITPITTTGALWNTGAAVGAVVGGAGYLYTR
ncbi:hypothetical protein [Azospirillum sp.]|uniref:hypothetical protein n=1 Tax=Azospirillum sp. TaxID=34012 RepID=UPI003D71B5AB